MKEDPSQPFPITSLKVSKFRVQDPILKDRLQSQLSCDAVPDELSPAHDSAWLIAPPAYADASNRSAEADFPILLDNLDNLDVIHDIIHAIIQLMMQLMIPMISIDDIPWQLPTKPISTDSASAKCVNPHRSQSVRHTEPSSHGAGLASTVEPNCGVGVKPTEAQLNTGAELISMGWQPSKYDRVNL